MDIQPQPEIPQLVPDEQAHAAQNIAQLNEKVCNKDEYLKEVVAKRAQKAPERVCSIFCSAYDRSPGVAEDRPVKLPAVFGSAEREGVRSLFRRLKAFYKTHCALYCAFASRLVLCACDGILYLVDGDGFCCACSKGGSAAAG